MTSTSYTSQESTHLGQLVDQGVCEPIIEDIPGTCGMAKQMYQQEKCCASPAAAPITYSSTVCPVDKEPVCCDGKTHRNLCIALNDKTCDATSKITKGQCQESCICTKEYKPVCCGGVTYGNACMAACKRCDKSATTPGTCSDGDDDTVGNVGKSTDASGAKSGKNRPTQFVTYKADQNTETYIMKYPSEKAWQLWNRTFATQQCGPYLAPGTAARTECNKQVLWSETNDPASVDVIAKLDGGRYSVSNKVLSGSWQAFVKSVKSYAGEADGHSSSYVPKGRRGITIAPDPTDERKVVQRGTSTLYPFRTVGCLSYRNAAGSAPDSTHDNPWRQPHASDLLKANDRPQFIVTHNRGLEISEPGSAHIIKFTLSRIMVRFRVYLEKTVTDKDGKVQVMKKSILISGEVLDLSSPSPGSAQYAKYASRDIHSFFDDITVKSQVSTMDLKIASSSSRSLIDSLHDILLSQNTFPWDDGKYEKRLQRYIWLMCIQPLIEDQVEHAKIAKDIYAALQTVYDVATGKSNIASTRRSLDNGIAATVYNFMSDVHTRVTTCSNRELQISNYNNFILILINTLQAALNAISLNSVQRNLSAYDAFWYEGDLKRGVLSKRQVSFADKDTYSD